MNNDDKQPNERDDDAEHSERGKDSLFIHPISQKAGNDESERLKLEEEIVRADIKKHSAEFRKKKSQKHGDEEPSSSVDEHEFGKQLKAQERKQARRDGGEKHHGFRGNDDEIARDDQPSGDKAEYFRKVKR